jgi:hypothetical protein
MHNIQYLIAKEERKIRVKENTNNVMEHMKMMLTK